MSAAAGESPVTVVSARSLPERLAQRGSEPLGVIDVRRPQQYYARMAGWFGQRLPLLNQLLARYHDGGEHRVGASGFIYRATSSFPPDLPNASGASSDLKGMVTTRVAQPGNLTRAGNVALGRVSIAHPTPAAIATAAGTELPAGATETITRPADLAPAVGTPVESAAASPAMTLRVKRQAPPLTDPAAGILNQPATSSSPLPFGEVMENRPAVSSPLATGLQTSLPVQPRSMAQPLAGARPIAETKRLPEPQPSNIGLEPVIARKVVDTISSASDTRIDATVTANVLAPTYAEFPAPMPLARRTATVPLSEAITGTADRPALPLILEKPAVAVTTDPVPGLVWRKSIAAPPTSGAGNSGTIDAASGVATYPADGGMLLTTPPIMRAESTNPPADNQPGAASPASMPSRAAALDLESLYNQFSRRLLRQLAIERERRGGKGWS